MNKKEFIEIPFGAKDSELCGWEYTIPEGYTASIENGKIVVKKEEGEGEKIRKWLIGYFNQYIIDGMPQVFGNGLNVKDVIAWLEKQGEQSIKMRALLSADKLASAEMTGRLKERKEITDNSEKYGLCKKSAWSEEDEEMRIDAIKYLELFDAQGIHGDIAIPCIEWLKSLKPQPQWKPSEEQIQALEYQVHSTYKGSWQYKASNELLEQLKKL